MARKPACTQRTCRQLRISRNALRTHGGARLRVVCRSPAIVRLDSLRGTLILRTGLPFSAQGAGGRGNGVELFDSARLFGRQTARGHTS
jgi:hypothetical protein